MRRNLNLNRYGLLYRIPAACLLLFVSISLPAQVQDFTTKPVTKWIFRTGSAIYGSPVVSGDLVYFGGLDSTLHAVSISTGKETWSFRTGGEIRSTPLVSDNTILLNGGDGSLYSLNRKSGKQLWKFSAQNERKYDFADYHHSSPVLCNKTIYFGSGDNYLYAVDASTGRLNWSFKTGNIVHTTPSIANGSVFFGSFDGYVYALDAKSGELKWKFKTVGHRYFPAGEVQGSPSVFNNLVFIGARDYNIYALDQEKGYCRWNKAFTDGWGLNNNIYDSVLYTGSSDERVLIASDPATGKEFWRKKMEFLVFGNNAYSDNMLYVGTTIGKLHGISLASGEKIWSFETESYIKNRLKYFREDDTYRDDIYSIIKSNEHFLEVECELGGIFSTPCIDGNHIFFTSTNGNLYCLERTKSAEGTE
jgi:outer membrane protein assembly factor BamB